MRYAGETPDPKPSRAGAAQIMCGGGFIRPTPDGSVDISNDARPDLPIQLHWNQTVLLKSYSNGHIWVLPYFDVIERAK